MSATVVTCIEIGASSVRAVAVRRRKDALEIVALGQAPLPAGLAGKGPEPDDLVRVLKNVLKKNRIPLKRVVLAMGGHATMLKYMGVPVVPPWKLEQVMAYEVGEQVASAGGIENVAYDYRILNVPGYDENQFPVMVALAQAAALEARFDLAKRAGVGSPAGDLGALGAFNLFRSSRQCVDDEWSILLDIGEAETHFTLQRGGQLLFARSFPAGGRDFTESIRRGLDLSPREAEAVKLREGRILDTGPARAGRRAKAPGPAAQGPAAEFSKPPTEVLPFDDIIPLVISVPDSASAPAPEAASGLGLGDLAIAGEDENASERIWARQEAISRALRGEAAGIVSQCKSLLRFFSQQFRIREVRPTKVYLAGGGSRLAGLAEFLARHLEMEVAAFDVSDVLRGRGQAEGRWPRGDEARCWALAAGLAAGHVSASPFVAALLPRREKEKRVFWQRTAYTYYSYALAGLALLLLFFTGCPGASGWRDSSAEAERAARWEEAIGEARARYNEIGQALEENRRDYRHFQALSARRESAGDLMAAWLALSRLTPETIVISRIDIQNDDLPETGMDAAPDGASIALPPRRTCKICSKRAEERAKGEEKTLPPWRAYQVEGFVIKAASMEAANDRLREYADALQADGVFECAHILSGSDINPAADSALASALRARLARGAPQAARAEIDWRVSLKFTLECRLTRRSSNAPAPESSEGGA